MFLLFYINHLSHPSMKNITSKDRFRYKFDNLMSRGTIALISWLGILSLLIVIVAAIIISFSGAAPEGAEGNLNFFEAAWLSLMRTLDPGTMGGDTGWGFRVIMLCVTIGGIFIVSTLIGVLASGIESKMTDLRKGKSFVIENGHTLILGWSSKVMTIISELIIANENQKNAVIVILADIDKVEMEDEIRENIPDTKTTKIICRRGSPMDMTDLSISNPQAAKSIIILSPETGDPDIQVIKTILAITNNKDRKEGKYHIVAEITDKKNMEIASIVGGDEATLIVSRDVISRIMVQTCRQSGLSVVYTELMDFDGAEIYFSKESSLVGKSYKDCIFAYEDSTVIGISKNDGSTKVNPPMDTIFESSDKVIAISEDDDTVKVSGRTSFETDKNSMCNASSVTKNLPEKTLILGWNLCGNFLLKELDNYVAKDSLVTIVANETELESDVKEVKSDLKNIELKYSFDDPTKRKVLEALDVKQYDHIILLCDTDKEDIQEADARTLITLLHLRHIAENQKIKLNVVSEMLDIKNKELAEITKADDFIVSDKLMSLMLSQLSENKALKPVFDDLFDSDGSEIYLKPAIEYVKKDCQVNFYTILECAASRGHTAIGYRKNKYAYDSSKAYGIVVNPKKSEMIAFEENDKIIVLAED